MTPDEYIRTLIINGKDIKLGFDDYLEYLIQITCMTSSICLSLSMQGFRINFLRVGNSLRKKVRHVMNLKIE